jgi:hypothetical protein
MLHLHPCRKGMMNMDAYFGGAEMQAMAQLIHIAEVR